MNYLVAELVYCKDWGVLALVQRLTGLHWSSFGMVQNCFVDQEASVKEAGFPLYKNHEMRGHLEPRLDFAGFHHKYLDSILSKVLNS